MSARTPSTFASMTPSDKVMCAISIIQNHLASADTALERKKLWAQYDMPGPSLEAAIGLLIDTVDEIEKLPASK